MDKDITDKGNGSKPGPDTPLIATYTRGLGKYKIERDVKTQEQVQIAGGYKASRHHLFQLHAARSRPYTAKCYEMLYSTLPILEWVSGYSLKKDLFGDVIAGLTTAIMHVPQGMAYALLANVIPTAGLYMAIFPALVYILFGTSRHVSMGTFAVISIMVGKIVQEHGSAPGQFQEEEEFKELPIPTEAPQIRYDPIEVATAVTLLAGIYMLVMYVFRLGALSSLLCEPLINGFTTAAAVAVLVSQMKDLFGLHIRRHSGMFCLGLNLYETIIALPTANTTAVIVSSTVIFVMTLNNELLKPWVNKYTRIPIPAELFCAIVGTAVSYYMDLKEVYQVPIVGGIPTGLPVPRYPPFSLLRLVAVDTIAVTIVSYSIVISLALIFAKKHQYTIRPNQELLAMGMANLVGAGFSCIPVSCSLTRTMIQSNIGGRTQMVTVVSASLIVIVLLWIAPFLEYLPRGVLAAIIVVALKGMFMQAKDLRRFWLLGKIHAAIWVGTFLGVVIIGIDIGLLIGITLSLLTLWYGNSPKCNVMGQIPGTDLYVDTSSYKLAEEVGHIKIIRYSGNISLASSAAFKKAIYKYLDMDVKRTDEESALQDTRSVRILILDMSSIRHADAEGICSLFHMRNELEKNSINLIIAAQNDGVLATIRRLEHLGEKSCVSLKNSKPIDAFPTIHDAVTHSLQILRPHT